ncbi:hypothetical protein ACEPAF_9871 [Sanghuangporus sanghuang]
MDDETNTISPVSPSPVPTLHDDQEDAQRIVVVPALFDNAEGDIILRSSDEVDFRVFKVILALASPVFKDMFTFPQPSNETENDISVIPVSESSETIIPLLEFCYPVNSPRLAQQDISVIGNVLGAALKYDMQSATGPAREALKERAEICKKDAVVAYAIACHLKLEEEARAAALACLKWPIVGFVVPQLALISGLDYFNLLDFHSRACDVVKNRFSRLSHSTSICKKIYPTTHQCNSSYIVKDNSYYTWWNGSCITEPLRQAPLGLEKISLSTLAANLKQSTCHICKDKVLEGWEKARTTIITAVKNDVSAVSSHVSILIGLHN